MVDPDYVAVASNVVRDARTLGACLELDYLGPLADVAGEVAAGHVPFSALFNTGHMSLPGDVGHEIVPDPRFSVDSLFTYLGESSRMTPAGIEVVWLPDEESHSFSDASVGGSGLILAGDANNDLYSTVSSDVVHRDPVAIVIAWRGFASEKAIKLKRTKVIEWRPSMFQGQSAVTPVTVHPPDVTATVVKAAQDSGIITRVGDFLTGHALSAAYDLASTVYSGAQTLWTNPNTLHALTAL
jgi:hypothetical protein